MRKAASTTSPAGKGRDLERDLTMSAFVFAAAVCEVFESLSAAEAAAARMTTTHLKLLYLIARAGRRTVGDAAEFLGVSSAAASKTVDKLVRDGLLRRSRASEDRRASLLSATAAGRKLVASYAQARRRAARLFLDEFSDRELRTASRILDRLAEAIVCCVDEPKKVCMRCGTCSREDCRFKALGQGTCIYQSRTGDIRGAFRRGAA